MTSGERQQVAVRQIDQAISVRLPDGTIGRIGYRLSELIEMFGGYEGLMPDPKTESDVLVSLEEWRNSDPETTYLEVGFLEWRPAE